MFDSFNGSQGSMMRGPDILTEYNGNFTPYVSNKPIKKDEYDFRFVNRNYITSNEKLS